MICVILYSVFCYIFMLDVTLQTLQDPYYVKADTRTKIDFMVWWLLSPITAPFVMGQLLCERNV